MTNETNPRSLVIGDLLDAQEVFEDFMKKTNEDMVKRYGLESDDE